MKFDGNVYILHWDTQQLKSQKHAWKKEVLAVLLTSTTCQRGRLCLNPLPSNLAYAEVVTERIIEETENLDIDRFSNAIS